MFADVFDMLFGCWHRRYSFPITAKRSNDIHSHAADATGTYVVCLDCGKEFPYDWDRMKVLSPSTQPSEAEALGAAAAARLEKVA